MNNRLYYFLWGATPVCISVFCFFTADFFNNTLVYLFAYPIDIIGFFFIWGDNGPPNFLQNFFVDYPTFNSLIGLIFWLLIGLFFGFLLKKIRKS